MEGGFLPEPSGHHPLTAEAQVFLQQPRPQQHWNQQQPLPQQQRHHHAPSAEGGGGCERCPNLSIDPQFLEAFGVRLCSLCKRGAALISKVRWAGGAPAQAGGRAAVLYTAV